MECGSWAGGWLNPRAAPPSLTEATWFVFLGSLGISRKGTFKMQQLYDIYTSWYCIIGGIVAIVVLLVVFFVMRNMRKDED